MKKVNFGTDRTIISTSNNEYADGLRDETAWEEELYEQELPVDDILPDATDEYGEDDRPLYDENGYEYPPAD